MLGQKVRAEVENTESPPPELPRYLACMWAHPRRAGRMLTCANCRAGDFHVFLPEPITLHDMPWWFYGAQP